MSSVRTKIHLCGKNPLRAGSIGIATARFKLIYETDIGLQGHGREDGCVLREAVNRTHSFRNNPDGESGLF
jgi:hypothetical protein